MPTPPADARPRWPPLAMTAWGLLFLAAAIMNAGGYRYGASDQAFYIPAALHHVDPTLFPRDWSLLAPQDRLNVFTALTGWAARTIGVPLPALFFAMYLADLLLLFAAGAAIGSRLFRSRWTVVALLFALTLRHAVAMGAVNTLEAYLQPRLLAFAFGALAVAVCLNWKTGGTPVLPAPTGETPVLPAPTGAAAAPLLHLLGIAGLLALAVVCHPTTAAWFVAWVGVALAVADRRFRMPLAALVLAGAALGSWAVLVGPLAGRLAVMDEQWLSVLASKTYLFPTRWPVGGWLPAVLTPLAAAALFVVRRRRGLVSRAETGIAAGAAVLFVVFLASIPFTAARLALAVQLQVPRTLWMIDLLAVVYIAWYVAEGAGWARRRGAARAAALVFIALSFGRGAWVMFVQHPERELVEIGVPAGDWRDATAWLAANTPKDTWVLAPPGHAWRYGTSVRVSAERDVYLEEAKDSALALYSRASAMTVLERIRGAANFDALTEERARAMGPDVLLTEREMNLPLLHRSGRFRVYRLR